MQHICSLHVDLEMVQDHNHLNVSHLGGKAVDGAIAGAA
jgi:hypothetical protein